MKLCTPSTTEPARSTTAVMGLIRGINWARYGVPGLIARL